MFRDCLSTYLMSVSPDLKPATKQEELFRRFGILAPLFSESDRHRGDFGGHDNCAPVVRRLGENFAPPDKYSFAILEDCLAQMASFAIVPAGWSRI